MCALKPAFFPVGREPPPRGTRPSCFVARGVPPCIPRRGLALSVQYIGGHQWGIPVTGVDLWGRNSGSSQAGSPASPPRSGFIELGFAQDLVPPALWGECRRALRTMATPSRPGGPAPDRQLWLCRITHMPLAPILVRVRALCDLIGPGIGMVGHRRRFPRWTSTMSPEGAGPQHAITSCVFTRARHSLDGESFAERVHMLRTLALHVDTWGLSEGRQT